MLFCPTTFSETTNDANKDDTEFGSSRPGATEARRLRRDGYETILTHSRWCFLKNPENLTEKQRAKLNDLMTYDLASVRVYLLKESFQLLWEFSRGIVEGLNYKIKLSLRKAYGYRSFNVAEVAFYHALGKLPEPEVTHEFC